MRNYTIFRKYFEAQKLLKQHKPDELDVGKDGTEFYRHLSMMLDNCKIFRLDSDIKRMLMLTKTPIKSSELNLPFEQIFLDVEFTKKELAELGFDIRFDTIVGVMFAKGVLQHDKLGEVGTDLRISMLSIDRTQSWFDSFNTNCNITSDDLLDVNVRIQTVETSDKVAKNAIHKLVLNFLNFINSTDVEIIESVTPLKTNRKRLSKGKFAIPNQYRIELSDRLKRYIHQLNAGGHFSYNYSFWIRGHFRTFRSSFYKKMQGKRKFIPPFVKGKGILIDKWYDVHKGEED